MKKPLPIAIGLLILTIGLTALLAFQLTTLKTDNDTRRWIPSPSAVSDAMTLLESIFGNGSPIIVGVSTTDGTILEPTKLSMIQTFSGEVSRVEGVYEVSNLLNSEFLENVDGDVVVSKLHKGDSFTEASIALLKERLESWDLYRRVLYSSDYKDTSILVKFSSNTDADTKYKVFKTVVEISQRYQGAGLNFSFAGKPVLNAYMDDYMKSDLRLLLPLVILALLTFLAMSLRSISSVVLILLSVLFGIVWTMGFAAMLSIPLSVVLTTIPIILVAISSAYGIHFLHHFNAMRASLRPLPPDNFQDILDTLKTLFLPLFLSALTTAVGFSTLAFTQVIPIQHFGIVSAFGVMASFVVSLIFIPCCLVLMKPKIVKKTQRAEKKAQTGKAPLLDSVLGFLVFRHPILTSVSAMALVILSLVGMSLISVDSSIIKYFSEESIVRKADRLMAEKLAGAYTMEILVEARDDANLYNPDVLSVVDSLGKQLEENPDGSVRKVISYVSLVKRMNQVMMSKAGNEPRFYEIPTDLATYGLASKSDIATLISQYMLLFSGSAEQYINDTVSPTKARIVVMLSSADADRVSHLDKAITTFLDNNLPSSVSYSIAGVAKAEFVVNNLVIDIKIWNIVQSIALVLMIVILAYRSVMVGLVGMVPVLVSVLIGFGVMGFLGIRLNLSTAMISSLTVGVGIDYTIHFLSRFRQDFQESRNVTTAIEGSFRTVGSAILLNAASVTFGFAIMLLSSFVPLKQFGFLMCLSMVTSSFGALIVLPLSLRLLPQSYLERVFCRTAKLVSKVSK